MFARILVCLDGSKLAEQILPYVEAEASRFVSTLILLQITPEPVIISPGIPGTAPVPVRTQGMLEDARRAAQEAAAYLGEVAEQLKKAGIQVDTITMPGRAGEAIVRTAFENNADLIALVTHGRSGLGRAIFGSVADFVLRQSLQPVLIVGAREPKAPASIKPNPFEKILICLDGSKLAEQILPYAEAQAIAFASKLILLQVVTVPAAAPVSGEVIADQFKMAEKEAKAYLHQVAQSLRVRRSDIEVVVVQGGPIGDAIVSYADNSRVDLICLATHGRGGLGRAVFGSVADQVLRQAGLPILLKRPHETKD